MSRRSMTAVPVRAADLPIKTNFRFDEELHKKLAEAARRELRSINSEMLVRLRNSFEQTSDEQSA
jgi:hypothetical protein